MNGLKITFTLCNNTIYDEIYLFYSNKIIFKVKVKKIHLQNIQELSGLDWKTNTILNNSMFIDTEFVNDIYDDFSKFPNSYDTSMLFMIGLSYIDKNILYYKNFTTDKLLPADERILLTNFLIFVIR
jgi:hypothetical protein